MNEESADDQDDAGSDSQPAAPDLEEPQNNLGDGRLYASSLQPIAKFSLDAAVSQAIPELSEVSRKNLVKEIRSFCSLEDFFTSSVYDQLTKKDVEKLKEVVEEYLRERATEEIEKFKRVQDLVKAIGCIEEIAEWICDNQTRFPNVDDLLKQPELDNLSNKHIRLIKEHFGSHTQIGMDLWEFQIAKKLNERFGLSFDICREIVMTWGEGQNLQELFESEVCEDITRKQGKAIAVFLAEEMPITQESDTKQTIEPQELPSQEQEIVTAIGCSKEIARWICENWSRFSSLDDFADQPELENLKNKQLKLLKEKLKSFQRDQATASKINNSFALQKKIGKELALNFDVSCEIVSNWKAGKEIAEILDSEELENITIKQQKLLSKILMEELPRQNEISSYKAKLRSDEPGTTDEVNDSLKKTVDKKDENREASSSADNLSEKPELETLTNKSKVVDTFHSSDSYRSTIALPSERKKLDVKILEDQCFQPEVEEKIKSDTQVLPHLKEDNAAGERAVPKMEAPDAVQYEKRRKIQPTASKQGVKFPKTTAEERSVNKMIAEAFPLITCADHTQGDRVVEQFLVRTEHIKQLCNLKKGCKNFYYDISSGLNINFTELSNYELDLVGVLGRLDNANEFFERVISKDSLEKLNNAMAREGSGMYLVVSQLLYSSATSKGYVYFYSENNQDYHEANQKSRAVHFFRYISQLTKNIFILLDKSDFNLLSQPSILGGRKRRPIDYIVCQLELQKEDVKLEDIGITDTPQSREDSTQELHTSNLGMFLVSSKFQTPKLLKNQHEKSVSADDFKHFFSLSELNENAHVCDEFKEKYIEMHHRNLYHQVEKKGIDAKAAFLDGVEDNGFYKDINFAVIQDIYKNCFKNDFKLTTQFFQLKAGTAEADKWQRALQLNVIAQEAIPRCIKKKIETVIKEKFYAKNTIRKIILERFLFHQNIDTSFCRNIDDLIAIAHYWRLFGDWVILKPSVDSSRVQEKLELTLEGTLSDEWLADKLYLVIKKLLGELELLANKEMTKIEVQNSQYTTYKMTLCTRYIQPQVEKIRREEFKKKFSEIQQQDKTQCTDTEGQSNKVIESIVFSPKSSGMPFKVTYQKTEEEECKMILDMYKIGLNSSSRDKLHGQSEPLLDARMLTFMSTCRIELPKFDWVRVFPINAGSALITLNCGNSSKLFVFGTSKGQQQMKGEFGRKIFLSEFDTINRILCLYSEYDEKKELNFYQFDSEHKNFYNYNQIDMFSRFNFQGVLSVKLQYGSKFVWALESTGNRILKLSIKNGTLSNPKKLNTSLAEIGLITQLHMAPNGQCVFLSTENGMTRCLMTETFNLLQDSLQNFNGASIFQLPETGINLVARFQKNAVCFQKLTIHGAQQEMKLQECAENAEKCREPSVSSVSTKQNQKHWIYNFQWVFTKFPCEDIFNQQQKRLSLTAICSHRSEKNFLSENLNRIQTEMKKSLESIFKPTKIINEIVNVLCIEEYDKNHETDENRYLSKMEKILMALISFTPMQIARCQSNELLVLKDGIPLCTENVRDAFEMKENIDLGLFEAVFNWWSGNVKVISSMGKQTTGKSYMLNHVMGSSFNISGARCTDGCWMTLNLQEDCLYVILDFEGLGSFERTDQDDMLLSLFNSAISTMTLFKTEQRIDRDTDHLFSKFNLGSEQLKGTRSIFQGRFVIVIKDVADADFHEIEKEFFEKINSILLKEKQNNFISKLYKGGFRINPFPPFQTIAFFEEIETLRENIISAKPLFFGGPKFRDTMKLLLAKLAISDFTPLGKQQIETRIKFINSHLKTALFDGVLRVSSGETGENSNGLNFLDKQNERVSEKWSLTMREFQLENIEMIDTKCHFTEDGFIDLVNQFSQHIAQTSTNFTQWRKSLENFVIFCLENRFSRVKAWITGNLEAWKKQNNQEFDDAICLILDNFQLEKMLLRNKIQFCNAKCTKCFLKCTQIAGHASVHACSTSHRCMEKCFYCKDDLGSMCKHPFGHENQHICNDFSHICGQQCSFRHLNGCLNECILLSNHTENHKCSLEKHLCKKKCSVGICFGECQIDCTMTHEVHKCVKEQCVHECCIANCKNKCTARDHFHGNKSLTEKFKKEHSIEREEAPFIFNGSKYYTEDHFCGDTHFCGMTCEEEGYCEVLVEKAVAREEIFKGKRATFAYKKQFVQKGKKLPCLRKILPFQKEHNPPKHSCTLTTKNHFCTETCPTCDNICDKRPDHVEVEGDERHRTIHGNMTNCYFICNQEDFDVGDHKYKVGEQSVAEFCNMFCSSLGRGHIHVVECPGSCKINFSVEHDYRRHETCKYGPNKKVPKDEIQHKAYWELINFEDPCTGEQSETFGKCPFYCSAASHEEEKSTDGKVERYHCKLDLWHKPVLDLSETKLRTGTVSTDGHVFGCHHEKKSFHWVLALDRSGSMRNQPWKDLLKSTKSFMTSRKEIAPEDKYSILLHDHEVHVIEEYKTVKNFDGEELSKWSADGENDFALAISESDKVIGRNLSKSISPVFIFMSDGIWDNGEEEMEQLSVRYTENYNLKVFTIGFGRINFGKLKKLAQIGKGEYMECATGIKLESSFLEIASSMPPTVSVNSSK